MKNLRANDMYGIIAPHLGDPHHATFVDFGCGYGDMLSFVLGDGADFVVGIDKNRDVLKIARDKCKRFGKRGRFWCANIEEGIDFAVDTSPANEWSYAFCFSVLPYLESPVDFLRVIIDKFDEIFIEMQYFGDGPGYIPNDTEMNRWLYNVGFFSALPIGSTDVQERNVSRTIWKCSGRSHNG